MVAAEEAATAVREERDVLLADADAKNARQIAMQDRISKLEVRTVTCSLQAHARPCLSSGALRGLGGFVIYASQPFRAQPDD